VTRSGLDREYHRKHPLKQDIAIADSTAGKSRSKKGSGLKRRRKK
jgi:hypothetical protein